MSLFRHSNRTPAAHARRIARPCVLLWLLMLWSAETAAQQATLVGDAHVSATRPTVNAGSLSNLNVGGGYTALLQFDLGSLPAGLTAAQVTRATLKLFCNRADTPGSVSAQLVTSAWTESTVTYATLPSSSSNSLATGSCSAAGQFLTLDITAAVQAWLVTPAANFGLALTSPAAVLQFDSKENDLTAHAPELDIALSPGSGGSGVAGATGATGATGAAGATGSTGAPGLQGLPGPAGAIGATGPTGAAGIAGATGATGAQGLTGIGLQGVTGATGSPGATGVTGAPGLVYQGAYSSVTNYALGDVVLFGSASFVSLQSSNHGNTPGQSPAFWGVLTAQGSTGLTGASGATGTTGPQGLPGSLGPAGEKGDTGAQGPAGQAGAQGIPGVTGGTGIQGPVGATGVAGPTGLSFQGAYNAQINYALGDGVLWQGAGYVSLITNNHGNTPDQSPAAWALFAASGAAGVTGATGLQGLIGATGATGIGLLGAAGPTGATGPQGAAGLAFQGVYSSTTNYNLGDAVSYNGSSYVSLIAGNHGNTPNQSPAAWSILAAQGVAGPTGAIGSTGLTGAAGLAGLTGATGETGLQGPPVSFTGTWNSVQSYAVGDAVSYSGSSYIAVAANTGHEPDTSPAFWSLLASVGAVGIAGPQGVTGATGTVGQRGDTGAQGPAGQAGAQGIQGVTGVTGVQGSVGATGSAGPVGLTFLGAYNSQTNYALGAGVLWQGAGYVSLVAGNQGNTPDQSPAAWSLFAASGSTGATGAPGLQGPAGATGATGIGLTGATGPAGATGTQGAAGLAFQGAYSSATSYNLGDAVSYNGSSYVSLVAANHGNTPDQSPAAWAVLAARGFTGATGAAGPTGLTGTGGATGSTGATGLQGPPVSFLGAWSNTQAYAIGSAVSYLGSSYIAVAANMGREPDTSPLYWSLLASMGSVGATGVAGPSGPQGPIGYVGATGPQGVPGPTGVQGSVGATGSVGAIGPQGLAGPTGAVGGTGVAGPAGPSGATGIQGPPVNFAGAWSTSRTYAVGDAVSYLGSSYIAVAASTSREPDTSPLYWSLLASAGAPGPTGAVGATGFQGPTGSPGATGPQGATGAAGAAGATGSPGATGPQGLPGVTGPAGATGSTGAAGATGTAGTNGVTGATGVAGAPGLNFRSAWAANLTYTINDGVTFGGSTYLALAINSNMEPDQNPGTWSVLAQAGLAGATGSAGSTGAAATISVGTVTVLPAGSAPTVTNTGTSSAAVLAFGLPAGSSGSTGTTSSTGSSNYAAMVHAVNYLTTYYSINTPNTSNTEGSVLAWVPRGCTASRLDVYSLQSNLIKVTLRSGSPSSMANTALVCDFSTQTTSSCTVTGSVSIPAGSFLDFSITGASGTSGNVWTALECD